MALTAQELADDMNTRTPAQIRDVLDQAIDIFISDKTEAERMNYFAELDSVGIHIHHEITATGCKRKKSPKN